MQNNVPHAIIKLCAIAGKHAIDQTKLPFWGKEGCKLGVDIAKWLLEALCISKEALAEAALSCGIEKVVAIPLPSLLPNSQHLTLLRAHGGDVATFFSKMGFCPLAEKDASQVFGDIAQAEKEHGIVLYERA